MRALDPLIGLAMAIAVLAGGTLPGAGPGAARAAGFAAGAQPAETAPPSGELAARLLGFDGGASVSRAPGGTPFWTVARDGVAAGAIGSTWEIARSTGYSGQPVDVFVAVTPGGRIAGAELMRHNEPILTLGISTSDIAAYVGGFAGYDLTGAGTVSVEARGDLPDVISRATVSTGVIRDAILRTARAVAMAQGTLGGGGIDRAGFEPETWQRLATAGALVNTRVALDQARAAFEGARVPVPSGPGAFLDLWAGVIDPPSIGQNLLGATTLFNRVTAGLAPGDAALFVGSRGVQSHRGTAWRRSGMFRPDHRGTRRAKRFVPSAEDYVRIDRLALDPTRRTCAR